MTNTLHRSSSLHDLSSIPAFSQQDATTPPGTDGGLHAPQRRHSAVDLRVSNGTMSRHRAALGSNTAIRPAAGGQAAPSGSTPDTTSRPTALPPSAYQLQTPASHLFHNHLKILLEDMPSAIDGVVQSLKEHPVHAASARQLAGPITQTFGVMRTTLNRANRSPETAMENFMALSSSAIEMRDVMLQHGLHHDDATVDHLVGKMFEPDASKMNARMAMTLFPSFIGRADPSKMSPQRMVSLATSLANGAASENGLPAIDKAEGWTGDWYAGVLTAKLDSQGIDPSQHPGLDQALSRLRQLD